MLFCVLNSIDYPCARTHLLHVRKLGEGFVQRGYHYKELNRLEDILSLKECDLLYVSNHFSVDFFHRNIASFLQRRLLKQLNLINSRLILWCFHTMPDWNSLLTLQQRAIHLSEDMYNETVAKNESLHLFRSQFDVLCIKYSSPMHPDFPNLINVRRDLDFNFVGHGYQKEMTRHCSENYRSLIFNTPPPISEPMRVNSFRRAEVNLVFHSPDNISKGTVVERFAEALSYGGIVFHDQPRIAMDFPAHPSFFYVTNPKEIDRAFDAVMSISENKRAILRKHSWKSWKLSGLSYFNQAERILKAFSKNAR